ncbi:hypothetical protein CVS44_00820 [Staphylococcus haemolyticus]|nr:hypothetical protein CVS44_00820 [Staphylococcus haemolyticus]
MVNVYRVIVIFLSIISIIASLVSTSNIPINLVLIPLIFLILFIVFPSFSRYMFYNLGITIINFTMLLRYVVSPLLMAIYGSNIQIGSSVSMVIQGKAVNLMLYEMIVLFVIFAIFHKYFYSNKTEFQNIKSRPNLFGWLFVAFTLTLVALFPTSIGRYAFLWSASELKNDVTADVGLTALLVQIAQIVITLGLLNVIYKFYERKPNISYLFLSLFVIMVSASFIIGTSRSSIIIPLITGLYTVFILYKNYRKLIITISAILSLLVISVSTLLKQNTNIVTARGLYHSAGALENFNTDVQIYFSGLINISHSIETSFVYQPFHINSILGDITHSIIFVNSFFDGFQSALISFNDMFYKKVGVSDQILPLLGQGYLYFGAILAPMFSIIVLFVVMLLDKNIHNSNSVFTLYVYAYLCLKFALFFMSNATILLSFFTNFFLVLFIIAVLNKKFVVRRRTK